jgi:predicted NBD/HSP70 family sugar kinase
MKRENRRHVLSIIGRRSVSRIELAKETHLSQAAITEITSELLREGIIVETGKQNDSAAPGRKPISLDMNAAWGTILGINIEREYYEIGLFTVCGVLAGETVRLDAASSPEAALDGIADAARRLLAGAGIDRSRVIGIGAIAPGPVDAVDGVILNPINFDDWHGFRLKEGLERRFPYKVYMQHNATAFIYMENLLNNVSRYENFALFAINAGIGFGLVLNGQVYAGARNLNSEIAHTSIETNGRLCACGNFGCLEVYASVRAVLHEIRRVYRDVADWRDFIDLAHQGDPLCATLLDQQAGYLAHSIANLNNILELDAVIITGLGAYRGELLLGLIRKHVSGRLQPNRPALVIENSGIKDHIGVTAAATLVIDQLFNQDLFAEIALERRA